MDNRMAKLTAAYFDSIGFKYSLTGENNEAIDTGIGGMDNLSSVRILFIFDDDESSTVHAIVPQLIKIPSNKKDSMYKVINDINQHFRWVKFYIDSEGDVQVDADAILDFDTCGKECFEILQRMASICDEAYPMLMKELWK